MKKEESKTEVVNFQPKEYMVGVISLGCDKNRVDTENLITYLIGEGYLFTSDPSNADIIIVNTCAFIEASRKESRDNIDEMINIKKNGKCKCLVVTGCYPQKYMDELLDVYPDVDIFLGTNEYKETANYIKNFFKTGEKFNKNNGKEVIDCVETGRVITTPIQYAYLKVADGCDNFCSYCTIPYIRGRYRSRKIESIVREATDLVKNGARELILVAQDLSKYGVDIYKKPRLSKLVESLSEIKDLEWIRLLYCYPENIDDDLIYEFRENKKLCKYIDIPFQHISDKILAKMNRKVTKQQIIDVVEKLKREVPEISIRTTFMIGFPGETKEDFNELLEFIKKYKLENVGFFAYSKENGTVAGRFEDQIDDWTKQRRLIKIAKTQRKIVKQNNKQKLGKIVKVMYEGVDYNKSLYYGRTEGQAPDIDTIVYFTSALELEVGQFYDIRIKRIKGYDLVGELI